MITALDAREMDAGTVNSPSDCKIPTKEKAIPVKSTVGNMIRVRWAVSAAVSAS